MVISSVPAVAAEMKLKVTSTAALSKPPRLKTPRLVVVLSTKSKFEPLLSCPTMSINVLPPMGSPAKVASAEPVACGAKSMKFRPPVAWNVGVAGQHDARASRADLGDDGVDDGKRRRRGE